MRGLAMRNLRRELVGDDAHRSRHQCFGDRRRNRGQRQVGGRQCHAQRTVAVAPTSIMTTVAPVRSARNSVWPRERDAGIVDHALLHRRSDHRGEFAGEASGQRGVERREHRFGIGPVESSGNDGYRERKMRDLEGSRHGVARREYKERCARPHADGGRDRATARCRRCRSDARPTAARPAARRGRGRCRRVRPW